LSFTIPPLPPYVGPPEFQAWWQQMAETVLVAVNDLLLQQQYIEDALRGAGIALTAAQQRMPAPLPMELDLPGDLPATQQFSRYDGGDDVTLNSEWSMSVVSGTITASMAASTGILTVTALSSDSVLEIMSVKDDVPITLYYSVREAGGAGAGSLTVTEISAHHAMTLAEDMLVINSNAGAITVTLPDRADSLGSEKIFKRTDAQAWAVIINAAGSDTIEGGASASLSGAGSYLRYVATPTEWKRVG
jgi:hypothetical protein